jgi:hypothetical protein
MLWILRLDKRDLKNIMDSTFQRRKVSSLQNSGRRRGGRKK